MLHGILVLLMVGTTSPGGARATAPGQAGRAEDAQEERQQFQQLRQRTLRFLRDRKYARAAATAERLVERFPEDADSWRLLTECHLQPAWALRNDSRCEAAAEKLLSLVGREPEVLRALAVAKYRQRRPEALQLITELVDSEPPAMRGVMASELLHMRARMLLESPAEGSLERARADLDRALEIEPNHSNSRIERAALRLDDGEPEAALEDLDNALQRRAGDREVHYLLSRCYRSLRDMDKARHHREVSSLINRLVDSLGAASAPTPQERLEVLARLREINPADGARRVEYVDLLLAQGQLERARSELVGVQGDFPRWAAVGPLASRVMKAAQRAAQEGGGGDVR